MVSMISPPVRHGQPTNLLDNSDFAIAQAGYGGMHGATRYVADRWANTYGFGTFKAANPGIVMTYATNHAYANQRISNSTRLLGKTLTLAVMTDEFGLLLCSGQYTASSAVDARYFNDRCEIVIVDGSARIVVVEGALTIRWAALYEGAYTNNTLPSYVPPDPAAELIKCKKYFVKPDVSWKTAWFEATGRYLITSIPLPGPMRIKPSLVYSSVPQIYASGWQKIPSDASVQIDANEAWIWWSTTTMTGVSLTAGSSYLVQNLPALSAEL